MNFSVNSNNIISRQYVAQFIVNKFIEENTNNFKSHEIVDRVNMLVTRFLNDTANSITGSQQGPYNFTILIDSFPEDMKAWALAKRILKIDGADNLPTATHMADGLQQALPLYTLKNQNWNDIELVIKAKAGIRGAWIYSHTARGEIVVKGQELAENQLMGTVFLQLLHMNPPDIKMVDCGSEEGKQLTLLGEKYGLTFRHPKYYLVMDRVKGPAYADLSYSHYRIVLNNLEKLGELAVYDLVLGNFDRFQLDSTGFNAGNLMFENGDLRPIDTDCVHDKDREDFTLLALKKIVRDKHDYNSKIARKLADHFGNGIDHTMISEDKIRNGMKNAVANLVELTKNMESWKLHFIQACKEKGYDVPEFPNHLMQFILHIKDLSQK